jgi:uncharacterized protein YjbI with pentapeptide repeats
MEQRKRIGERIGRALTERIGTVVLIVVVILISVSIPGYFFNWEWTGLCGTTDGGPKTLWHWLDLLIIPMVLAAGALWFRRTEEDTRRALAAFVEAQRAEEAALETYFDRMSELLLDKDDPLLTSRAGSPCQDMASTRTVTVLRRLDQKRRNQVFDFLLEARLLGVKRERVVGSDDGTKKRVEDSDPIAILAGRSMRGIDLSGADLKGADLREANLARANLRKANLSQVFLRDAHLDVADLREANLGNAYLTGVWLTEAKLERADLRGAKIDGKAELRRADLSRADLRKAYVRNSTLNETKLYAADLRGAILSKLVLDSARLKEADLRGADLSSTRLNKATLFRAKLSEANLSEARLNEANLEEADLRNVRNLTCDQLKQATNWEKAYRDKKLRCGAEIPKPPQAE